MGGMGIRDDGPRICETLLLFGRAPLTAAAATLRVVVGEGGGGAECL
jgi:hypothetical protein